MPLKYIACPSNDQRARDWEEDAQAGRCVVVGPGGLPWAACPSHEALLSRLPEGWLPDFALVDLSYPSLPGWLWRAPLPLVALAPDWGLQWPLMRLALPRCSLAFSDHAGARALNAAGHGNVRPASLFGLSAGFEAPWPSPAPVRDIDVLFVGSLNPAVQGERLPWLARLARLSSRWRVHIATGVFGEEYQALLLRARVVFNRSLHGEENQRVAEAASCGALVLQERGNPEMEEPWREGRHCACYCEHDLEAVLDRYLDDEPERARVAAGGLALARERRFAGQWRRMLDVVEAEWEDVARAHQALPPVNEEALLMLRAWQALGAQAPADDALPAALEEALAIPGGPGWPALALAALSRGRGGPLSARRLHAALGRRPSSPLLALGLAEALFALGETSVAAEGARRLLGQLLEGECPRGEALWPLHDASFGPFRVAWHRAAWANAADAAAASRERSGLLRWRLHALLAAHTGELSHFHEAALAWPEAPGTRAALGCALARAGRPLEAAGHLRAEVGANPFDQRAARALYQALADAGLSEAAEGLAEDRRALLRAAPELVPDEPWMAPPPVPSAEALEVRVEGPLLQVSSLALVNRKLLLGLQVRGRPVGAREVPSPGASIPDGAERAALEALTARSRRASVTVRHSWPPDATPPECGHWVLMQPWEFGSLPKAWLPMLQQIDEAWAPTSFVRQAFLDAGAPPDRVKIIPLGADPALYRPDAPKMVLPTRKRLKFLFVGGTIYRKGFDVLLSAFGRAFRREDDVCLVVKDMGVGSFYRGQTAEAHVHAFQAEPNNPEVVYLTHDLTDEEMAGLYAACDCLVLPYRGEGFGLPLAEAMSSGIPVIATGLGAALDFVDQSVGWLVPASRRDFSQRRVGELETVGTPWLAEPSEDALVSILHEASSPHERERRGAEGRRRVESGLTWGHTLMAVEEALARLRQRPVRRLAPAPVAEVDGLVLDLHPPGRDLWVSRPLLEGQPYEPLAVSLLPSLVRPGDTVLDVGANVGLYALRLARLVGPSGRVFAVEPCPDNLALLHSNVERNGCNNVTVLPVAASDRDGAVRLYLSADNQGDHRVVPAAESRPSIEVRAARLDGLLEGAGPVSLIKLDVQGAEGLALAGLQGVLARSPQATLLFEFWPWGLERAGTPAASVLGMLVGLGYCFEVVDERQGRLVPLDAGGLLRGVPSREDAFVNVLARKAAPAAAPADAPVVAGQAYLPGVSLCVIARDEEANIGACLDSAAGLFDQAVVLDTGSRDRTVEIAQAKGAEVHHFTWIDDFAAARNECLKYADRQWAFWLDADDRLDEENREKLKALLAALPDTNVAYSMKCRCLPDPETGSATLVDHLRLFRNGPNVRWRYRVHEQILPALREGGAEVRFADVVVDHTGYVDSALRGKKLQRDLRILEAQRREMGDEPFTLFNLGATYLELNRAQDALPLLERSLALSNVRDSIVRKLHSLISHALLRLGRPDEALSACLRGLRDCPGDAELGLLDGTLRLQRGDAQGAKATLLALIAGGGAGQHFASVADGLRTFRARHQLAEACARLGEHAEAEALLRQACSEAPGWRPSWSSLARLLAALGDWAGLEETLAGLERLPNARGEAAWWRGKALLDRGDAEGAAGLLGRASAESQGDASVRLLHALALERAGQLEQAERELENALAILPDDARLMAELARLRALRDAKDRAFIGPVGEAEGANG